MATPRLEWQSASRNRLSVVTIPGMTNRRPTAPIFPRVALFLSSSLLFASFCALLFVVDRPSPLHSFRRSSINSNSIGRTDGSSHIYIVRPLFDSRKFIPMDSSTRNALSVASYIIMPRVDLALPQGHCIPHPSRGCGAPHCVRLRQLIPEGDHPVSCRVVIRQDGPGQRLGMLIPRELCLAQTRAQRKHTL